MTIKRNAFISLLLVLMMAVSMFTPIGVSAYAVSQSDIDAVTEKRNEVRKKREAQQAIVNGLKDEQAEIEEQKRVLDERNAYTIEQINLNAEEIALYDEMIAEKQKEVDAAVAQELEQLNRYRTRVRAMEERGSLNILALILNSNSLGELLTTIDDVGEIMESDRELEDDYIRARLKTEQVKAEFEEYKAGLVEIQDGLKAEQAQLEQDLKEAEELIAQYIQQIQENKELADALVLEEIAFDNEIQSLVAQREAERQQAAQQAAQSGGGSSGGGSSSGGGAVGSGSFAWPVSCTYITSCVGYRYHPITGAWKYHAGMDIGASYGSTVWASDSGTVILSGWNGGYGECVMIDHGNGYYTLYGHLSSRAVSQGQSVSKGDTIGYVGSTGNSTGPHLHFEIRDGNNQAIDFSSWFSGLTYAPDSGGA